MHARTVWFAACLAIVCLLTSRLHSDEGTAQQVSGTPVVLEPADDLRLLEDANRVTLEPLAATGPRRFVAERPAVPARSVLRTTIDPSKQQSQNPENANEPQPLKDPKDLGLPSPSPVTVPSLSPAPLDLDVSAEPRPSGSANTPRRSQPRTHGLAPIDVNISAALPVISIETANPVEINVGKTAKYQIAVKNLGDITAENLQVIATLPEQVDLIEATPQPTDRADDKLHFDVGSLDAKESRLIELQLVPRETGAIDLAAMASFSVSRRATMHVRRPQITMTCETPEEAIYGDKVTFLLVVKNVGDGVADGIVVTPQLPSHALPDQESNESLQLGWLRPGDSKKVPVTASAIGPGVLKARFTVSDASGSEANVDAKIRIRRAVIEVAADGPRTNFVGREGVYEIRVSNPGDTAAENVKVVASLPAGLQLTVLGRPVNFDRRTNTMTWYLESVAAGSTETLPFKARAVTEGELAQEITASADRGLFSDTRQLTQVMSRPKINVAITSKDGPLAVGDATEFQIGVQNVGTKAAEGLRVTVITPEALAAAISDDYVTDGNEVAFSPMTLAVGETKRLKFRAVGREPGDHIVRVILESQSPSHSLSAETSAFFYDSEDEPRVSSLK